MTAPAYKHPPLKSLSEAQSEKEDPQCDCGTYLDEENWKIRICIDCQERKQRAERRAAVAEFGEDDLYYGTGRGMPRG